MVFANRGEDLLGDGLPFPVGEPRVMTDEHTDDASLEALQKIFFLSLIEQLSLLGYLLSSLESSKAKYRAPQRRLGTCSLRFAFGA